MYIHTSSARIIILQLKSFDFCSFYLTVFSDPLIRDQQNEEFNVDFVGTQVLSVGNKTSKTNQLLQEKNSVSIKQVVKRIKRRFEVQFTSPTTGKESREMQRHLHASTSLLAASKPYFENTWPRNYSVIRGQPASLKCRIRFLGDKMVHQFIHFFFLMYTFRIRMR